MKNAIILISLLPTAISASAQESTDTIEVQDLQELVIEAPRVIRKPDMDVYYPPQSVVDISKNGMQLLQNMMIPSMTVNDALGTISAAGESVEVRINGRQATIDQVRSLLPGTVKRVEWLTNPGLRFGGASRVLNFIVSNPTVGGSLMIKAQPALNTAWGNFQASAKFNVGRSQWEVDGFYKLTNHIRGHRDYRETFTMPDGSSLTRIEKPLGGYLSDNGGRLRLAYNYIKPDTTVFYVSLDADRKFGESAHYAGLLSINDGKDNVLLNDGHGAEGTTPRLSAYLERHLTRNQILVMDFSASFYAGNSYSDYVERLPESLSLISDIHTFIKDRNQAYAFEANYIRNWNNSHFTAGASYSANRNRSEYKNLGGEVFHQAQDKVYIFAEYFQRYRKFTFTAGLGAQYTDFRFRETGQGSHSWNLRPQASISYSLNPFHQFRLNFSSWQSAPSLAETNIAPQQIDAFQWRVGNPALKTSTSYMLTLSYNFGLFSRLYGTFGIRGFISPDAITPLLGWEDEKLITTYENSRGLKNLTLYLAPQVIIVPEWLMASAYLEYRMERMRGTGYSLSNNCMSGNIALQLTHWGFVLTAQYQRARRDLWGEKISWGEDMSVIDISYNYGRWQFSAGMIMPFGKYDQGSEMLSKWNSNEQHTRLDMRMPYISVSYNLQWGRQKRGASKLINIDANVDRSSTSGR